MNPSTTADHHVVDGPDPATRSRRAPLTAAAVAGAIGGLALFGDLFLHLFGPLARAYFVVATAMAVCLLGVPTAVWLRGAIATGWRRGLAIAGTMLVGLGAAAWITAFVILFGNPGAAFSQRLTPAGSALMALGMVLLGTAVLASRRLAGVRTLAPLVVGLYFPAQLIIQLAFFLDGNDGAPGPNGALLGTWGVLWAWAAWASATASRRNEQRRRGLDEPEQLSPRGGVSQRRGSPS